jgi:hypothetical protein
MSWFRPGLGVFIHMSVHKSILCPIVDGN